MLTVQDHLSVFYDDFENTAPPITLLGLSFERTSFACPEAYDVYRGELYVGRIRLRYGRFVVRCYQETILFDRMLPPTHGDGLFPSCEVREAYIHLAALAINSHLRDNNV